MIQPRAIVWAMVIGQFAAAIICIAGVIMVFSECPLSPQVVLEYCTNRVMDQLVEEPTKPQLVIFLVLGLFYIFAVAFVAGSLAPTSPTLNAIIANLIPCLAAPFIRFPKVPIWFHLISTLLGLLLAAVASQLGALIALKKMESAEVSTESEAPGA